MEVEHFIDWYTPNNASDSVGEFRLVLSSLITDQAETCTIDTLTKQILVYMDTQLFRLSKWMEDDIDLLALVTRNLIELMEWSRFISENTYNMECFINESKIDLTELLQFDKKFGVPSEYSNSIIEFVSTLERQSVEAGFPHKRVVLRRADVEDSFMHKLCSKFIHPTAYSIVEAPDAFDFEWSKKLLRAYCLHCAANILRVLILPDLAPDKTN